MSSPWMEMAYDADKRARDNYKGWQNCINRFDQSFAVCRYLRGEVERLKEINGEHALDIIRLVAEVKRLEGRLDIARLPALGEIKVNGLEVSHAHDYILQETTGGNFWTCTLCGHREPHEEMR